MENLSEYNNSVKIIILGFDGILFNTDIYHYISWRRALLKYGINIDQTYQWLTNGYGKKESLDRILKDFDLELDDEQKKEVIKEKDRHLDILIEGMVAEESMPGIIKFLDEAKAAGFKLALSTSSTRSYEILKKTNLSHYFDTIIDPEFVEATPSINIEAYYKILEDSDIKWYNALIVSSSNLAIDTASKALIKTISVGPKEFFPDSITHVSLTSDLNIQLIKDMEVEL